MKEQQGIDLANDPQDDDLYLDSISYDDDEEENEEA